MDKFELLNSLIPCAERLKSHMTYFDLLEETYIAEALEVTIKIIESQSAVSNYSPEAIADLCVDNAQAAEASNLKDCSNASDAFAGLFYAAGEVNNALAAYTSFSQSTFNHSIVRFLKAAKEISSVSEFIPLELLPTLETQ